jgi:phosphatidylserine/phosphatidylglycerophosphate/cardiolipin synthase-like enzyme
MTHEHHMIAEGSSRLASRLPYALVLVVAESIIRCGQLERGAARQAILQSIPTPDFREATAEFVDLWYTSARQIGAEAVAVALVTAAKCEQEHRHDETVEVVWTGPEPFETRFRQTEQAVLEVIESATHRLTMVSYAVYRIPRIREALITAANRGVRIRLIVETPSRIEGQGEYDCLLALGQNVASACSVYYWPQDKRSRDDNGKIGILHVKCAIADGYRMFLTSANLTDYAFTINMELGLLVSGGRLPEQIDCHFDSLIREKHLSQVA